MQICESLGGGRPGRDRSRRQRLFPTVALPKAFASRHSPAIERIVKCGGGRFEKFPHEFFAEPITRSKLRTCTAQFCGKKRRTCQHKSYSHRHSDDKENISQRGVEGDSPIFADTKIGTVPYSVPLVLGTPERRGSASTAMRSARAVALKIASAMWWLFRP